MQEAQKLSDLINEVEFTLASRFAGRTFWIKAQITDVKKQADKRWCFLKLIEKDGSLITAEIKAVFWSNTYHHIENFERATQQVFKSGLEIVCNVRLRFHKRYGIDVEMLAIDFNFTGSKTEQERTLILQRLVQENEAIQQLANETFSTTNKRTVLPVVIRNIALITAPNSDGYRDFHNIISQNKYGYTFNVTPFLTTIQGDKASVLILQQLRLIAKDRHLFDVVVICRGGGSDTDFSAFDDYELARGVALFSTPVLTGIGHDRNTSITDLMARQLRTPTEAATFILDINLSFETELQLLKDRFYRGVYQQINTARYELANYKQRVKNLHPNTILKKGFAILMNEQKKIVTNPQHITLQSRIDIVMQQQTLQTTVVKKISNEKSANI